MGVGAGLYMCDVVKKVHVRYLISWWVLVLLKHPLNPLMLEASTARWFNWFHLMITVLKKTYLQQSRVHRNLAGFQESRVKKLVQLNPRQPIIHFKNLNEVLPISLLSSSVHSFKHCNLFSYVFPSMLLIIFVRSPLNLRISISFNSVAVLSRSNP